MMIAYKLYNATNLLFVLIWIIMNQIFIHMNEKIKKEQKNEQLIYDNWKSVLVLTEIEVWSTGSSEKYLQFNLWERDFEINQLTWSVYMYYLCLETKKHS